MSIPAKLCELTRMPEYIVFGFKTIIEITEDQEWKARMMHRLDTTILERTRNAYCSAIESLLTQEEIIFTLTFLKSETGKRYLFRMHADIPLDGSKPRPANDGRLSKKEQDEANAFLSSRVGQVVFLISSGSKTAVNQVAKGAYLNAIKQ